MLQDDVRIKPVSLRIDEICDEYETAFKANVPLRIEDCLDKIDTEYRPLLFRELFSLELELLQAADEKASQNKTSDRTRIFPTQEQYLERFSQYPEDVTSVFVAQVRPKHIGNYVLLEELGHGGMGVVFKARHKHLGQVVAVKILSRTLLDDSQAVARFRREMQLIGRLNHPHIVRALNAGESESEHFLAMEFVDGISLHHLVTQLTAKEERVPLPVVCEMIRQVAMGLQNAHEFELIHRDIKPANLILDFSGTVKILDLGLGKFMSEKRSEDSQMMTQIGETMGTVDYMAPEQCENASTVDIRADIYSLGCTFYYLATGFPPYHGPQYDTIGKKLRAHMASTIPSLSDKVSPVEPELERIFKKMMAKEPKHRFQTPQELADALEPFADAEMVAPFLEKVVGLCDFGKNIDEIRPLLAKSTKRASSGKKPSASLFDAKGIALGILLTILLVIMGVSIYGWRNPKPVQPMSRKIYPIQVDTAQLPGLNGGWWFDEIPWFTPTVREYVVDKIDPILLEEQLKIRSSTDVSAIYSQLLRFTDIILPELPTVHQHVINELKTLANSNNDVKNPEHLLEDLLAQYQTQCSMQSATDSHTLAILQHRLATLKNDSDMATAAMVSYNTAIDTYRKDATAGNAVLRLLEILCLADHARLVYPATRKFDLAKNMYQDVLPHNTKTHDYKWSPIFLAELQASYGADCAATGNFNDSLFDAAAQDMQLHLARNEHPLSAYIAERYAWSLMDQWKINDAKEKFDAALKIRLTNNVGGNHAVVTPYILHNQHGIAMTYRYLGDTSSAIQEYRKVLKIIESLHNLSSSLQMETEQYGKKLSERAANTRERLADCLLYGGAASGITHLSDLELTEAAELYTQAAEYYVKAEQETNQRVMQLKATMIYALVDDVPKARDILDTLTDGKSLLGNQSRLDLLQRVAKAVVAIQQNETAHGQKLLKEFLVDMESPDVETDRRDGMEMRLFCAEMLLASVQNSPQWDKDSVEVGVRCLLNALTSFWGDSKSAPFKRRYVDIIVRFAASEE